jgi:hypothetical protein
VAPQLNRRFLTTTTTTIIIIIIIIIIIYGRNTHIIPLKRLITDGEANYMHVCKKNKI